MSHKRHVDGPRHWLPSVLILVLAIAIHAIDSYRESVVIQGLRNAGHIPLFMALTLFGGWLLRFDLKKTAVTIVFVALLAEASQRLTGGEVDPRDLAADLVGLGLALLALKSWSAARLAGRLAAVSIILAGFLPAFGWMITWQERTAIAPCLVKFDHIFLNRIHYFMHADPVELTTDRVVLALQPSDFAGWRLIDPIHDWTEAEGLRLKFSVVPNTPVTVRIHDREHTHQSSDRYNRTWLDGRADVTIPLSEIRTAPKTRELSMDHISEIQIFVADPKPDTKLTVHAPCLAR
ncbi:MAG: hypothetical protein AAGL69_06795 [Pseudomonadota bacterium]